MNKVKDISVVGQTNGKKKNISVLELEERLTQMFEFRLDVVLNKLEYREQGELEFKEVNINSIYRSLHQNDTPVSLNTLKIILGSDFVPDYDPIKSYFENIQNLYSPSEHGDYIAFFCSYLKAVDPCLLLSSLRVWLVSAVNCALDPEEFNRKILVFFNTVQESGKTSLARFLIPKKLLNYSVENSVDGKDGLITLTNAFIHILDEMAPMYGRNMQEFKSFISRDKVDVRPPYEAKRISRPRISSFIGTSDRFGFLPEDAGTSRFIVNEIEQIDFEYAKEVNSDILWSQALYHLSRGEYIDFTSDEKKLIQDNNQKFVLNSILSEVISHLIEPGNKHDEFVQTVDIVKLLAHESPVTVSERKIGSVLGALKFVRTRHYCPKRKMTLLGYYIKRKKHLLETD